MDQWSSGEPRALLGIDHGIPGSEVRVPLLVCIFLTLFLYPFIKKIFFGLLLAALGLS